MARQMILGRAVSFDDLRIATKQVALIDGGSDLLLVETILTR
jgi:methionine synthase I (cobalamin-dependent)